MEIENYILRNKVLTSIFLFLAISSFINDEMYYILFSIPLTIFSIISIPYFVHYYSEDKKNKKYFFITFSSLFIFIMINNLELSILFLIITTFLRNYLNKLNLEYDISRIAYPFLILFDNKTKININLFIIGSLLYTTLALYIYFS